jgi:hypothetical protein
LRASTWDTDFDKFSDLTLAVFEGFLPWLLRACNILSEFVEPVTILPWPEWTEKLQSCRTKPDEAELVDRLEE